MRRIWRGAVVLGVLWGGLAAAAPAEPAGHTILGLRVRSTTYLGAELYTHPIDGSGTLGLGTEVDLERQWGSRLSWRTDVNVQQVPNARSWESIGEQIPYARSWEAIVEQTYLRYRLPVGTQPWQVTVGRYNTPMGAEGLEADRWTFVLPARVSRQRPQSLTGAMLEVPVSSALDMALFYDTRRLSPDEAHDMEWNTVPYSPHSVGLRLGVKPSRHIRLGLARLSGMGSRHDLDSEHRSTLDLTVTPAPAWTLATEVTAGSLLDEHYERELGEHFQRRYDGYLLSLSHAVNSRLDLSARVDQFRNRYQTVQRHTAFNYTSPPFQRTSDFTQTNLVLAARYQLRPGLRGVLELRHGSEDYEGIVDNLQGTTSAYGRFDSGFGAGIGFSFSF